MSCLRALLLLATLACFQAFAQPTYNADVAPLVQGKCQRCHRPGDIAPFELATYKDAVTWSEDIKRVLEARLMPPWKPVPGHGEFADNFGLSDEERKRFLDWIAAGTPEGDPVPEGSITPPAEVSEWELGTPDAVATMPEAYDVPRLKDVYRCFVLPTGLTEDKFIEAVQIKPGNKQVVHHVILFLDSTGQAEKFDAADPDPGYTCYGGPGFDIGTGGLATLLDLSSSLGGWVPGSRTQRLPEGVGLFLKSGTRIVMQVHYFPAGRPGSDQTKVGLYFSRKPVERRMRYIPIVNSTFKIPPGRNDYEVKASLTIPPLLDAKAIQIVPHMHLLGRKIAIEVERRDKSKEDLIYIDDWDFNWQNFYTFAKQVPLPSGSTIRLTCTFDNTAENPKNPSNPLKTVGWGEGTEDEMCIGFAGITFDRENLLPFSSRIAK
ncbi:MAG: ascorbate-dependent monooxygenase [Bryobacteraceae bacterium]|nr:ascorbate-dependent monooxygenase [Bryobacteraceae bacterium]